MFLWTLKRLCSRFVREVCSLFLEERLEIVGGHWRFAHTAGGLPSFVLSSFIAAVLFPVISRDQTCNKEEGYACRIIAAGSQKSLTPSSDQCC